MWYVCYDYYSKQGRNVSGSVRQERKWRVLGQALNHYCQVLQGPLLCSLWHRDSDWVSESSHDEREALITVTNRKCQ